MTMAGFIVDSYDDLNGRVLRGLVPKLEDMPPFIKEAHRLTGEQIDLLPDDQFALVMFDNGRKLKKYATVDKGNTALSVMYLLKQAHLLPPEAVKVAAANLLAACEMHELAVPAQLKIAAKTGVSGVSGKSQKPYVQGAKVIKFKPRDEPGEFTENPQLGKGDHNEHDVIDRTNFNGPQGSNFLQLPQFSQKEKAEPGSGEQYEKVAGIFTDAPGEVRTKEKTWRDTSYVDVSGWDPRSAEAPAESASATRTLLGDRYPVDSMDQVKMAADYFTEYKRQFEPRDRHEYCTKLAARMGELNMSVPEEIARYGSDTYSADIDSMLMQRKVLVGEDLVSAIETLIEKRASFPPESFVEALEEFDKLAGLNYFWDSRIPDPFYTTFGPSVEKLAEESWTWDQNGARVNLDDLENLARNGVHLMKKSFGDDFAKSFSKSPKSTFESLPLPNKLMVARMAMSRHDGTPTE